MTARDNLLLQYKLVGMPSKSLFYLEAYTPYRFDRMNDKNNSLEYKDLKLEKDNHTLLVKGKKVNLTKTEYAWLALSITASPFRPGSIKSRSSKSGEFFSKSMSASVPE